MGEMEPHMTENPLFNPPVLEPKPTILDDYDTWKYGSVDYASPRKSIL